MIILDTAGDTIQAEASAASSITVNCYGIETASGTDSYKRLGTAQLTGSGTQDTIYTVPASTVTICSVIVIANTSSSTRTIKLWDVENGGSPGDANAILPTVTIPANSSIIWNRGDIKEIPTIVGGDAGFSSKCSAYRSTTQSINNVTWTKIELATEDYDVESEFDATTNYRFQPDTTGYYHVSFSAILTSPADQGIVSTAIRKNNVKWIGRAITVSSTQTISVGSSFDIYLLDSDYIELFIYQSNGGAKNTGGNRDTFMTVHRIS